MLIGCAKDVTSNSVIPTQIETISEQSNISGNRINETLPPTKTNTPILTEGLPTVTISSPTAFYPSETPTSAYEVIIETPSPFCDPMPTPVFDSPIQDPGILLSGRFFLCSYPLSAFDLDKGIAGKYIVHEPEDNLPGTDIYFRWGLVPTETYIRPLNDASLRSINVFHPTLAECTQIFIDNEIEPLVLAEIGNVICVRTDEGRLGYLRVEFVNLDKLTPFNELVVELSFVIWDNP